MYIKINRIVNYYFLSLIYKVSFLLYGDLLFFSSIFITHDFLQKHIY